MGGAESGWFVVDGCDTDQRLKSASVGVGSESEG